MTNGLPNHPRTKEQRDWLKRALIWFCTALVLFSVLVSLLPM